MALILSVSVLLPLITFVAHSSAALPASIRLFSNGDSASPTAVLKLVTLLLNSVIWLSVVEYRVAASSASALFSRHASLAISRLSLNIVPPLAMRKSASVICVSVIPSSFSTAMALPPLSSTPLRPSTNSASVPMASSFQALANSSALIPATEAKSSSFGEPVLTSVSSLLSRRLTLPPPASALMPRLASVLANASTSLSVMPTVAPAPASLCAISTIWLSVLAPALPSATMVLPMRS